MGMKVPRLSKDAAEVVNGVTISRFREGLPEYRRVECYEHRNGGVFDIAAGLWLAQVIAVVDLDVESVKASATSLHLDRDYCPVEMSQEEAAFRDEYCPVQDSEVAKFYDRIDLSLPLLFGTKPSRDLLTGAPCERPFLVDGHHRLRKAFLEGSPLKAVYLDAEQTRSIRW